MKHITFLLLFFCTTLKAQSYIEVSADTAYYMTNPQEGAMYKVLNADPVNNPEGFPIYIQYLPFVGLTHGKGQIELPYAYNFCPVTWDCVLNRIHEFYDPYRNIYAKDLNSSFGGLLFEGTCIKAAIEFTNMAYASGSPQWQNIYWDNATVDYSDSINDLEFVSINMKPSSRIIFGDSTNSSYEAPATLYYGDLNNHSTLMIGYGSTLLYTKLDFHAHVEFGKYNALGANQGLGEGTYYNNFGVHSNFKSGDYCLFDSVYITFKDASVGVFGDSCEIYKPIVVGERSTFSVGDHALINGNVFINGCASLVAGDYFHNTGHIAIEDFVYVSDLEDSVTWGSGTIRRDGSTLQLSIDIGSDTTPDMKKVRWGGVNTINFTGDTITITSMQNLRNNCTYDFYAPSGKVIIFSDGSYFKMNSNANFVATGNNKDFIRIKTNSNNSAAYEIGRYNY